MVDPQVARNVSHRIDPLRESGRFPAQLLEVFANWISTAPDEDLFRVNPLLFAHAQGVEARDAIDLFVHATRAGIFDFAWGMVCKDCGAFVTTRGGIRALSHKQRACRL
jgi:hypothetical protein